MIEVLIVVAVLWGAFSPDRVAAPLRAAAVAGSRGAGQAGRQAAINRWAAGADGRAARREARAASPVGRMVNATGSGLAGLGRILGGTSTTLGGAAAGAVTAGRYGWDDARAQHDRYRAAGAPRAASAGQLIQDTFRRGAPGSLPQRLKALVRGLLEIAAQPQTPDDGAEQAQTGDQAPAGQAGQSGAAQDPTTAPDPAAGDPAQPAPQGEQPDPAAPGLPDWWPTTEPGAPATARTPAEEAEQKQRLAELADRIGQLYDERIAREAEAAQASKDSLPAGEGSTTSESEEENTPMNNNPISLDIDNATALQAVARQFAAAEEACSQLQIVAATAAALPDALAYGPGLRVLNVITSLAELAPDAKQLGEFAEMLPALADALTVQLNRNEHIASDGLTGEATAHVLA